MSVCTKFEECAAKTAGGVGFLMKAYFSLPQCCQLLAHGCQYWDIDKKFKIVEFHYYKNWKYRMKI